MIALVIALGCFGAASSNDLPVWEGRFSQCSYNAVSDVLIHFEGPTGQVSDRDAFEHKTFVDPINAAGYGPYYGWGPWTGYMVESGKMVWNGKPVTDLKAERFSLRPEADSTVRGKTIIVKYAAGEREALQKKLLDELAKGPVVLWTPYAGALRLAGRQPWHHVKKIDDQTDSVPFGPFTHSVALFLQSDNKTIAVDDCSVNHGLYTTDAATIVSTSAAMTAFVRVKDNNGKSMLDRGFNGIENDEYNVVFYRSSQAPATQPTPN
jgi:hypothetical protein